LGVRVLIAYVVAAALVITGGWLASTPAGLVCTGAAVAFGAWLFDEEG
jgi:hypothetical protein